MKSLEDLAALKKKAQEKAKEGVRIVVVAGTCGIASGALEVIKAVKGELAKHNVEASINKTGCIGLCEKEPIIIIEKDGKKVAYGDINAQRAAKVVEQHVVNNQVVDEWVVDSC